MKKIKKLHLFLLILFIVFLVFVIIFFVKRHREGYQTSYIEMNKNIDISSSDSILNYYKKVTEDLSEYTDGKELVLVIGYIEEDGVFSEIKFEFYEYINDSYADGLVEYNTIVINCNISTIESVSQFRGAKEKLIWELSDPIDIKYLEFCARDAGSRLALENELNFELQFIGVRVEAGFTEFHLIEDDINNPEDIWRYTHE